MVQSMKHETEWRYQIGELMLRFAEIEASIWCCLIFLPEKNELNKFKTTNFTKRCSAAIDYAKQVNIDKKTKIDLISEINRASRLAKLRNLVAHNPVGLNIESLFDEHGTKYEIQSYINPAKKIELEELKFAVIDIQECSTNLQIALTSAEDQLLGYEN